jgi:hypothetical protein
MDLNPFAFAFGGEQIDEPTFFSSLSRPFWSTPLAAEMSNFRVPAQFASSRCITDAKPSACQQMWQYKTKIPKHVICGKFCS